MTRRLAQAVIIAAATLAAVGIALELLLIVGHVQGWAALR